MTKAWQFALVGGTAVFLFAIAPYVYFRSLYTTSKRLREVVPGRVYRSGQLTAEGFAEAVTRYQIRTIINVQDDNPDPNLFVSFWSGKRIKESELCSQLGVRYVKLAPDLVSRRAGPDRRPEVIEHFLAVMDREDTYPVLFHCKAGLHRTGILAAVYRMEYQGWSRAAAFRELKGHGFGTWACTSANDYVSQYVLEYRPGRRLGKIADCRLQIAD
jgi:protein tyrosine/serine phosphatase